MKTFLKGIGASDGIAIAKAYLLVSPELNTQKSIINDIKPELSRLENAISQSTSDLEIIREKTKHSLGEEEAQVFDAHLMLLNDPDMLEQIKTYVIEHHVNVEFAVKTITDNYISMFQAMVDNPYMQERSSDVKDITRRLLACLLGVKLPNPGMINEEVVVIAHDLTPSETAQLDSKFVKAFVTNIGGRTSHSAIMARSLEIPAVVGTKNICESVQDGQILAVNGMTGDVIINPTLDIQEKFQKEFQDYQSLKNSWAELKNSKSVTADGKRFELAANIGTPKDIQGVLDNGGDGVGLYRTEFLYMDSDNFPTEEEQYVAYKAVLDGLNGKPVVVRTMDIGGDKELPYFDLPKEMNPFLGFRALRISISDSGQDMFRTQIRALLRASIHGTLRVMFPMVALLSEFRSAKKIFDEEKAKLQSEKISVSDDIQLGIMIEIPAAAILADKFAQEVDFMSIGTNDLIQYSMAADRMSEKVSYLYQPYNPSILRLIKMVIDACHKHGKWVGMCGEMAGDQMAVPLLVGLGLDEFSMSASSILKTRSLMKKLDYSKMQELADKSLDCSTMEEVVELLNNYL